jgi:transglutaminase-like putative cysteine protease
VPQLFRWRLRIGSAAQVMAMLVLLGLGTGVFATVAPRPIGSLDGLPTPWAAFAAGALTATIARLYWRRPVGGEPLSLAFMMLALTACGGVPAGRLYPAGVVLFVVLALVARRQADVARAPAVAVPRHVPALAGIALVGGGVAAAFGLALPAAHAWVMRQVMATGAPTIGFSERLWLGSMRGLLSSSQPVMRVHGETDYLRGIVFNRYDSGRWSRVEPDLITIETPAALGGDVVAIDSYDTEPQRYFLPAEAREVAVSSGIARVDRLGVLEAVPSKPAKRVEFRRSGTPLGPIAPPDAEDVRLPPKVARVLEPLAREWTRGLDSDAAKLAAIERRLQREFHYSLDFERSMSGDPVLEFIEQSRRGHCEYFASAMALMARTLGIPARVVAGYRVLELNPIGRYYIVRDRNAHAWVEAWVGRWRTYDPTPTAEVVAQSASRTPWVLAVIDLIGNGWGRFLAWLDDLTPLEAVGFPLAVVLAGLAVRWLRARRRGGESSGARGEGPLECFRRLSQALGERGLERAPGETIERLALRVAESHLPPEAATRGADLLRSYAALRYGDQGDESDLTRSVDDYLRTLRT